MFLIKFVKFLQQLVLLNEMISNNIWEQTVVLSIIAYLDLDEILV